VNIWIALLGGGAGATLILGIIDRSRNAKFDRRKQDTGIKLDEATYADIASRAEQTNQTGLMAVGSFWQGQFGEIVKRVDELAEWQRKARIQMQKHREWDRQLLSDCEGHGSIGPPPPLDPDDADATAV
jgi:hypothetical protein